MKIKCYLLICLIITLIPNVVFSYNDKKTHKDITDTAIKKSNFVYFENNILNIEKRSPKDYEIITQIQDGSEHEDLGFRSYNHFYNPINGGGLDDYPFPILLWGSASFNGKLSTCKRYLAVGIPALVWAMNTECRACCDDSNPSEDDDCNQYSWEQARITYYSVLTSAGSDNERNNLFELFFEKFGRILHLLQDMSVPAHVRNDMWGHLSKKSRKYIEEAHITNIRNKYGNNYENYIEEHKTSDDINNYAQYAVTLPKYHKPQDYWDLDRYNGENPDITTDDWIGLAEFTNANFLSQRTIFDEPNNSKRHFLYPNIESIELVDPENIPRMQLENGKYYLFKQYRKNRDGQSVSWIISQKYISKYRNGVATYLPKDFILNDPVHNSYACILLPKTIAYTAGLINYFFRGRMGIVPKFSEYDADSKIFKKVTIHATNDSKWINDQIEPMPYGTIDLVIRYKASPDDNEYSYINSKYNDGMADSYFSESNRALFEFYVDMPATAFDVRAFLVYHGDLGEEEDSVAVGSAEVNFKGSVNIEGRLGATDGSDINGLTVIAKNTTGGDSGTETMSEGSVEIVVKYRSSPGEYFNVINVETATENISRDSTPIYFDLSDNPIPVTATDISISLIYNGKVGDSENSVCVSQPEEMTSGIDITVPTNGVYALTSEKPNDPSHDGFSNVTLVASNTSGAVISGEVQLVVSYRVSQGEPITSNGVYPDTSDTVYERTFNSAAGTASIPAGESRSFEFSLGNNPIPVWATDVYFWLVIKTLSGRTYVAFKDVYEPTPIVVSNLGDWTFLNGYPYEVDSFYGLSLALDIVDYDKTNDGYYLVYDSPYEDISVAAWVVEDAFFRLSSIYEDPLSVEEESGGYSFNYTRIAPGNYKRVYVLSDENFYFAESRLTWHFPMISIYPDYSDGIGNKLCFSELECSDEECSNMRYASPDGMYEYPMSSVKNQTDCPDEATCNYYGMSYPCQIRQVPAGTRFRGIDFYNMHGYSHDDAEGPYNDYSTLLDPLVEQMQ